MDRTDSSAAMASLASYADESDDEDRMNNEDNEVPKAAVDSISDEDEDTPTPTPKPSVKPSPVPSSLMDDDNSKSEAESEIRTSKRKKTTTRLVSYVGDMDEEEEEDEESDESKDEASPESGGEHGRGLVEGKIMSSSLNIEQASSLSRAMLNKSLDEIELPPEPTVKCSRTLQEKIAKLYERRRKEGINLNATIQSRVEYRNPSIYEKLIEFCGIDEKGTNYPPELFDMSIWGKESYYDALDKAQKADMEKREKERKERTKVEFVTGTKKTGSKTEISSSTLAARTDDKKRKSKWDAEPNASQTQAGRIAESINKTIAANANLTSIATGTKSTVIPATGSISKKTSK